MKPYEVSILIYDYLKRNKYEKTHDIFNNECKFLRVPDPTPDIFQCVTTSLLEEGTLEERLHERVQDKESPHEFEKIKKEIKSLRKSIKQMRRRQSSGHLELSPKRFKSSTASPPTCTSQVQRMDLAVGNQFRDPSHLTASPRFTSPPTIPYPTSTPQSHTPSQITPHLPLHTSSQQQLYPPPSGTAVPRDAAGPAPGFKTPEKRLSKRKVFTPKKLPECLQNKVEALTKNINSRDEGAAIDSLGTVAPWLDQFITSLSEPAPPEEAKNFLDVASEPPRQQEAALSLLALKDSAQSENNIITTEGSLLYRNPITESPHAEAGGIQPSGANTPPPPANLLALASKSIIDSPSKFRPDEAGGVSVIPAPANFEPILIHNKKVITQPPKQNVELIVLAQPAKSRYTPILPKTEAAIPSGVYQHQDSGCNVQTFMVGKGPGRVQAKRYLDKKPYHYQFSYVTQPVYAELQAIPRSGRSSGEPVSTCPVGMAVPAVPVPQFIPSGLPDKPRLEGGDTNARLYPSRRKEDFNTWDANIRQVIAQSQKPAPSPRKRKRRGKLLKVTTVSPRKARKSSKKGRPKKEKPYKNKVKGEKRRKKASVAAAEEKKVITPEFVDSSDDSELESSKDTSHIANKSAGSDTVMGELLQRKLTESSPQATTMVLDNGGDQDGGETDKDIPSPVGSSPTLQSCDPKHEIPQFLEENANPGFDIDESTRPKPVIISEKSQNSCSCSSSHFTVKPGDGKAFSFQEEQEPVDSPQYYEADTSTVTMSSLFPLNPPEKNIGEPAAALNISDQRYRSSRRDRDLSDSSSDGEDESEDEEERERVSKLPPLSNQEKDLLESSEDEDRGGRAGGTRAREDLSRWAGTGSPKNPPPKPCTPTKGLLSESDNDSSRHETPLKRDDPAVEEAKKQETKDQGLKEQRKKTELKQKGQKQNEQKVAVQKGTTITPRLILSRAKSLDRKRVVTSGGDPGGSTGLSPSSSPVPSELAIETSPPSGVRGDHEDSCDRWYSNLENRITHACPCCKAVFPSQAVLNVHKTTCKEVRALTCFTCERVFTSKRGLSRHVSSCKAKTPSGRKRDTGRIKIGKKVLVGTEKKAVRRKRKITLPPASDDNIDEFLDQLRYKPAGSPGAVEES